MSLLKYDLRLSFISNFIQKLKKPNFCNVHINGNTYKSMEKRKTRRGVPRADFISYPQF